MKILCVVLFVAQCSEIVIDNGPDAAPDAGDQIEEIANPPGDYIAVDAGNQNALDSR